jgi:YidC/Oxa1 family membrane protein insertase
MVVPLIFITVVARFPTGLTLYWATTNLWTVGQGLVTRRLVPRTPAPTLGRSLKPKAATAPAPAAVATPAPEKPRQSQQPRRVRRKKGGSRR